MGAVHYSIDTKLVEQLKDLLPLTTFVETGTFEGDSIEKTLFLFDQLYSVEFVAERYQANAQRFAGKDNVCLHQGDSAHFLQQLRAKLRDESVLYWLDAHWCDSDDSVKPGENQCPLLGELDAIATLNDQSVILIDDARYFLAPPPEPHDPTQWPLLGEIFEKLRALSTDHEIAVCNDVIVFSPKRIGPPLRTYLQRNQIDWLAVINQSSDRDRQLREISALLQVSAADRTIGAAETQAAREELQLSEAESRASEADRAKRLSNTNTLREHLQSSEADRAERLKMIQALQEQLRVSTADGAERLKTIHALQEQLRVSEGDRAERLKTIHALQEQLRVSEADRAERLDNIQILQERLQISEADRAVRLDNIHTLQEQLQTSEADRAERLEVIHTLQEQLRTNQGHRAELLDLVRSLQEKPPGEEPGPTGSRERARG